MTTLHALHAAGQSAWLDTIHRQMLRSGELATLVREQGLRGVTTNPSIFEKAVAGAEYAEEIARNSNLDAPAIYEQLALDDIRAAADLLRPVFDASERNDGHVSLEVSPLLAHDTTRTIDEARRLWRRVERENVMIKVPATQEGIPAIRQLLADGININVTLLFSRDVFERVAEAHISGLEELAGKGRDLRRIASVASFFVSRIDTAIDRQLERRGMGLELVGKTAIANARLAYQDWKHRQHEPRWQTLAKLGARPQRLLWASTSTKDPRLPDTYYVDALIGPHTVDTMPLATLQAFLDHGRAEPTLETNLDEAHEVMQALPTYEVDLCSTTERVLADGVKAFAASYKQLLATIESKRRRG